MSDKPSKAPSFQWYPKDCDTDEKVRGMSDAEFGFYIRLLNHSWINDGVPADLDELARVMGRTKILIRKYWVRLGSCFTLHPKVQGRLVNPKQHEQREAYQKYLENAAVRGIEGANRRWGRHRVPYRDPTDQALLKNESASPTASPSPKEQGLNATSITPRRTGEVQQPPQPPPPSGSVKKAPAWDRQPGLKRAMDQFPGEVKPDWDSQMWISVIETPADETLYFKNTALWKRSQRWLDGYPPTFENYLRKRQWKNPPREGRASAGDENLFSDLPKWKGLGPKPTD